MPIRSREEWPGLWSGFEVIYDEACHQFLNDLMNAGVKFDAEKAKVWRRFRERVEVEWRDFLERLES